MPSFFSALSVVNSFLFHSFSRRGVSEGRQM